MSTNWNGCLGCHNANGIVLDGYSLRLEERGGAGDKGGSREGRDGVYAQE